MVEGERKARRWIVCRAAGLLVSYSQGLTWRGCGGVDGRMSRLGRTQPILSKVTMWLGCRLADVRNREKERSYKKVTLRTTIQDKMDRVRPHLLRGRIHSRRHSWAVAGLTSTK